MKYIKTLLVIITTLLVSLTYALAAAPNPDFTIADWTMDDDDVSGSIAIDIVGLNNATGTNVNFGEAGIYKQAANFTGSGSYADVSSSASIATLGANNNYSIQGWVWPENNDAYLVTIGGGEANIITFGIGAGGLTNQLSVYHSAGGGWQGSTCTVTYNQWQHIGVAYSNGAGTFYLNGEACAGTISNTNPASTTGQTLRLGATTAASPSAVFNGLMDEFQIHNKTLTASEMAYFNASGAPADEQQYPYTTSTNNTPSLTAATITPSNPNQSSNLTFSTTYTHNKGWNSNVTTNWYVNGVLNKTSTEEYTNNTLITQWFYCPEQGCLDDDSIFANITATDNSSNTTTRTTNTVVINDTGLLNITAVEVITGNAISTFNISIPSVRTTTTGNITYYEATTSYNVTGQASGYANQDVNLTTVTFNTTSNSVLTFYKELIVNVTDISGSSINNYTLNVTSSLYNTSINVTSNPHTLEVVDGNYTISISNGQQGNTQYAQNNGTQIVENATQTINIALYTTNSFNIEIRDEQTRNLINNETVTLQFISSIEASEYNTSNGTIFVDAFSPAEIEIIYSANGYDQRSYYYYLTNQSFNNITLYLLNSSVSTTIIINNLDENGDSVADVTTQLLRSYILNGVQAFEIVEMDKSDFSGEAVFNVQTVTPQYIIKVVDNVSANTVLFMSAPFEITSTTLTVDLEILGDPLESFNNWQNIIYGTPSYNNVTKTWSVFYDASAVTSLLGTMCLKVDRLRQIGRIPINESCSSSTTATLTVPYNDTQYNGEGSLAYLQFQSNTENSNYILSIAEFVQGARSAVVNALGSSGAFLGAMIAYTLGTMLIFNPSTFVLGTIIGLIASFAIGLINVSWFAGVTSLIIMGGIIIMRMRT